MPIYCYKCFDCNHYQENKQSMDDDALTICPECKGDNFKRVIRNVGVIFKGSGFHINDYGRKSKVGSTTPAKKEESKTEEKTEKSKEKISESKPDKKNKDGK
ncbi:MAG: FmdB family transcriptional regulator [Candidatus Eremiobacteraeota bacterium]|nr:FmdB family transcriptional regulator [Candidatus Eremiobacteraeota bacterium]